MPTVGTGKNKKKYAYTVEGLKKAEVAARNTNQRVDIDRSVYGPTNTNPNMNPDSNLALSNQRNTSLRRKKPRPYKTNRKLT
tara:strand:- start:332 stop:577 length:246 start_codon:yes stop_codon:yes gene_type:complete